MSADVLNSLLQQVEALTPDEQRRLGTYLLERAKQTQPGLPRHWREIRGLAQPSLFGEDAQTYLSRTRREADDQRAQRIERGS